VVYFLIFGAFTVKLDKLVTGKATLGFHRYLQKCCRLPNFLTLKHWQTSAVNDKVLNFTTYDKLTPGFQRVTESFKFLLFSLFLDLAVFENTIQI
jgi:hypothetical protein